MGPGRATWSGHPQRRQPGDPGESDAPAICPVVRPPRLGPHAVDSAGYLGDALQPAGFAALQSEICEPNGLRNAKTIPSARRCITRGKALSLKKWNTWPA